MTPPPIFCRPQDAHLLPAGLSPKRALVFLIAAALTVVCALRWRRRRREKGALPLRHPDRQVVLSDGEKAAWARFEAAGLDDVGLAILDEDGAP